MTGKYRSGIMLAFASALAVLLAAWFIPLPGIIAGDDTLAPQRIPQTRANVASAKQEFDAASARYQSYIKTHDLAALLESSKNAIASAKANSSDLPALLVVSDNIAPVADYGGELQRYAQASEVYFAQLRTYDDDLMSWTRSLGPVSELLRTATFPFVEHLKKYPPPVGLTPDPPDVTSSFVVSATASLWEHLAALGPNSANPSETLDAMSHGIDDIWSAGRSIEYVAGLHNDYYQMLTTYDRKVQEKAAESASSVPQKGLLANLLNLVVGLVTFAGLAALFLPRNLAKAPEMGN